MRKNGEELLLHSLLQLGLLLFITSEHLVELEEETSEVLLRSIFGYIKRGKDIGLTTITFRFDFD